MPATPYGNVKAERMHSSKPIKGSGGDVPSPGVPPLFCQAIYPDINWAITPPPYRTVNSSSGIVTTRSTVLIIFFKEQSPFPFLKTHDFEFYLFAANRLQYIFLKIEANNRASPFVINRIDESFILTRSQVQAKSTGFPSSSIASFSTGYVVF